MYIGSQYDFGVCLVIEHNTDYMCLSAGHCVVNSVTEQNGV